MGYRRNEAPGAGVLSSRMRFNNPNGGLMKTGLIAARVLSLGMVLSAAHSAWAMPFSVGAPVSAEQGASISASLVDDGVAQLEAADILLTFDSAVFTYLGAAVGSVTSGFSLVAGSPVSVGGTLLQVELSLATSGAAVDGVSGSLVDLSFLIKSNAPLGFSEFVFAGKPLSDYDIPITSGGITVTQAPTQSAPEPVSTALVGVGILALAAGRRRPTRTVTPRHDQVALAVQ
jgi:hypothetical protein